jgi:hypothetical protein
VFDEIEELNPSSPLYRLLKHYADLGAVNRETWQDRLMVLDDLGPRELSRLHGELIARGWIEQNTGATPIVKPGIAAACYRISSQGAREYRRLSECDAPALQG